MREVFFQPPGAIAPGSFTGLHTNDLRSSVDRLQEPDRYWKRKRNAIYVSLRDVEQVGRGTLWVQPIGNRPRRIGFNAA